MSHTHNTDSIDITHELADLFTRHGRVYLPARTIPYQINALQLYSGNELICDPRAQIMSPSTQGTIFVSSGSVSNIHIEGGVWTYAKHLWKHESESQAAYCWVKDIVVRYMENPFNISSAAGTRWDGCDIYKSTDAAIRFTNFVSACNINRTKIFLNDGYGIDFANSPHQKIQNSITNCVIEGNAKAGIRLNGNTRCLSIRDTYFESNGHISGEADVDIVGGSHHVVIDTCAFANYVDTQTKRIIVKGNSMVRANNNSVRLRKTGDVFVYIDTNLFDQHFDDNVLNCTGDRVNYVERLYRLANGKTCPVTWTGNLGSGGVIAPFIT